MLKDYSTIGIGGPAQFFVTTENKEQLIEAVTKAREQKLQPFILGGGSNTLFDDNGFNGLVIYNQT